MKNNKILKTFIVIMLLISIETAVIAAGVGVVNADTVRVREKPGTTDSKIVGLVSIGDKVTITGEENGWYKVKAEADDGENIEGYIRKDLLTVEGNIGAITPTEEPEQPEENNNTNSEDTPNQAEGPNTNEETPSTEEPTETSDETVEKNDKTISTMTVSAIPYVGQMLQLSEETKIKILPSANSSNIAKLPADTQVTVLEVINSWCRIEAGENLGWVRIDQ